MIISSKFYAYKKALKYLAAQDRENEIDDEVLYEYQDKLDFLKRENDKLVFLFYLPFFNCIQTRTFHKNIYNR